MEAPKNRTVVVSGGSKGLGFGICSKLLSEGYSVATFSRKSSNQLEHLLSESGGKAYWEPVDVTDTLQLSLFLQNVKKRYGLVGYLVNNAGIAADGLLTMIKGQDISRMLQVNLESAIALTQMCLKQMMVGRSGAIVNVSSILGLRGYKGVSAYSATKAALDGFSRSLAKEYGSMGIRVNSVAPGFMDTDMTSDLTDKQKERITRQTPLGRLPNIEDVTSVIKFLLSEEARFVSGQVIVIDGGLTA